MKFNSDESMKTAMSVFQNYKGSWTAAREAGHRDADGVLVIPTTPPKGSIAAGFGLRRRNP